MIADSKIAEDDLVLKNNSVPKKTMYISQIKNSF